MARNIFFLISIFLLSILVCCKKSEAKKATKLFKINQNYVNRTLIEISGKDSEQITYYHLIPYGTGTVTLKKTYNLYYDGSVLKKAKIAIGSEDINVNFTLNSKKLITEADFFGSQKNINYTYDMENHLVSVNGVGIYEYEYKNQNLDKVIEKNIQGITIAEMNITCDDKINPLYQNPLTYLEEQIPVWGYFLLSKNNITSIQYIKYDISGNVISDDKYLFEYSYDLENRPLKQKRYYNKIPINNYSEFEYFYK